MSNSRPKEASSERETHSKPRFEFAHACPKPYCLICKMLREREHVDVVFFFAIELVTCKHKLEAQQARAGRSCRDIDRALFDALNHVNCMREDEETRHAKVLRRATLRFRCCCPRCNRRALPQAVHPSISRRVWRNRTVS